LYNAFFGLVIQPHPLGALNPRFWRTYLFRDVLAAIRLLRFGMRKPNFNLGFFTLDGSRIYQSQTRIFQVFSKRLNHVSLRHFHLLLRNNTFFDLIKVIDTIIKIF
jgi:hypothetical protein